MTGSGTVLDPYVIWDVNDLQDMALDLAAYYEVGQDFSATKAAWTWTPQIRRPTGDLASGGVWTVFPVVPATHFDKVYEAVQDGDATYITTDVNNSWALFNFNNFNVPAIAENISFQVTTYLRNDGSAQSFAQFTIRVNGVDYNFSSLPVRSATYIEKTSTVNVLTNPNTGLPWTVDDINGVGPNPLQGFGVKVVDASPAVRITQVFATAFSAGFAPVSTFTGQLDGKNHVISNFYTNRQNDEGALFGITAGALIKNVIMANVNITGEYDVAAFIGEATANTRIINCHSTGVVTGAIDAYDVAGLVGDNEDSTIQNCHSDCDIYVSGGDPSDIGGLVGNNRGNIIDSYATGNITVSGNSLYDIGGLAGDQGPYSIVRCHSRGNIRITANLDLFDCGGLVGCNAGTIRSCYATGDLTVTLNNPDGFDFGGLAGDNASGIIDQCFSTGIVSITVTGGAGTGIEFTGGLAGDNNGTISNSYSRSDVTVDNIFGGVWNRHVGGFCGRNRTVGVIQNCYSTGSVTTSPGMTFVGGFLGEDTATTTNCFWDIETSGQLTSAGGTGKTTTEMKTLATFADADWDIEGHSAADLADGYPFLSWQIPGSSPVWYIFVPGVPPPPAISVITLPATEIR